MTDTQTLQERAGEAAAWFETAERPPFVRVKNGAPEWIMDLVRHAHGDLLPDDWRY